MVAIASDQSGTPIQNPRTLSCHLKGLSCCLLSCFFASISRISRAASSQAFAFSILLSPKTMNGGKHTPLHFDVRVKEPSFQKTRIHVRMKLNFSLETQEMRSLLREVWQAHSFTPKSHRHQSLPKPSTLLLSPCQYVEAFPTFSSIPDLSFLKQSKLHIYKV